MKDSDGEDGDIRGWVDGEAVSEGEGDENEYEE